MSGHRRYRQPPHPGTVVTRMVQVPQPGKDILRTGEFEELTEVRPDGMFSE